MKQKDESLLEFQKVYQEYMIESLDEYLAEDAFNPVQLLRTAIEVQRAVLYMTQTKLAEWKK